MSKNKISRTFRITEEVDNWLDDKAEELDANKSELVQRAIKVYGAKVAKGSWTDPKFADKIDKEFGKQGGGRKR